MKLIATLLIIGSLLFQGCRKTDQESPVVPPTPGNILEAENQKLSKAITTATIKSYVTGWVVDEQNKFVHNARVECAGKFTRTDHRGYFEFKQGLTVNKDYVVIRVSLDGYMNAFRTFTPGPNNPSHHAERIMLQKTGIAQPVSVGGGTVIADNNIRLTFPANAVVSETGTAYQGNYQVVARYLDPRSENFPDIMPGMLTGLNEGGKLKALESLGMANVELKDSAGKRLEVAPGVKIKMQLPAFAGGPANVPLWHFNEKYGLWIQAGNATRNGNTYDADVAHFSIWNVDLEMNSFKLDLQFRDASQAPLTGVRVRIYRQNNNAFVTSFITDNDGKATLINCPSNESLVLRTILLCDTLSNTIASVTQDRTEVITLNPAGTNAKVFNFAGTLFDCNTIPLANQPFQLLLISGSNYNYALGVTDGQGKFTTSTVLCTSGNTTTVQTIAFYNGEYRYSATTTATTGMNNYQPIACSTLPGNGYLDNEVVIFGSYLLENLVRAEINKPTGPIFYIEVKNIEVLNGDYVDVGWLKGIQYLTGLKELSLIGHNPVTPLEGIQYLQGLTSLTKLNLQNNMIEEDISALASLTNLTELYLDHNEIENFSALQNLIKLTKLGLGSVWTSNQQNLSNSQLPKLSGLTNLVFLDLSNNNISLGMSNLSLLTKLEELQLAHNYIWGLNGLQNLTNLRILNLEDNSGSSFVLGELIHIHELQNLTKLTYLNLRTNKIQDLTPIQNHTQLTFLDISGSKPNNFTILQNLTQLKVLRATNSDFSNLTPIQNLTNLTGLSLSGNNITSIAPLQNLSMLRGLDISQNQVSNLTPIQYCGSLRELVIASNNLTTISPLLNANLLMEKIWVNAGNNIPAAEITTYKANHPTCTVY